MNYLNLILDEFNFIRNLNKFSVLVAAIMMESSSYRSSTLKMIAKVPVPHVQSHCCVSFNDSRTFTSIL